MSDEQKMPEHRIVLSHLGKPDHILDLDPLVLRDGKWINRVLFLPWSTPQRLIGFVHPDADDDVGSKSFMLHAAYAYYGQVAVQQVDATKLRVVEGPRVVIPYDLISPLDIHIGTCPSWVWVREQSAEAIELFKRLLLQQIMPPVVEPVAGGLIKP